MLDPTKQKICENLIVLREFRNITQGDLALALGSTQKSISSYERKRAFPKLEVLNAYLDFFNITYENVVNRDLRALSREELKRLLNQKKKGAQILAITVDKEDHEENIELVPMKAAAGYARGLEDPTYLKSLPRFRLPFLGPGTYRAFEIEGASMMPISTGSVVVGKYIENNRDLKKGDAYVLVMDDGVVFKRVFYPPNPAHNDTLLLISDNPAYEPYEVNISDIQQIWKAHKVISDM